MEDQLACLCFLSVFNQFFALDTCQGAGLRNEALGSGVASWLSPTVSVRSHILCCMGPGVCWARKGTPCLWSHLNTEDPLWQFLTSRCLLQSQLLPWGQTSGLSVGPFLPSFILQIPRTKVQKPGPHAGHQQPKVGVPHPFLGDSHSPLHFFWLDQSFTI